MLESATFVSSLKVEKESLNESHSESSDRDAIIRANVDRAGGDPLL